MIKTILRITFFLIVCLSHAQSDIVTIISWNIKDLGKTKSIDELDKIANLVKHADIIAIQEVVAGYGGAQAVAKLSDILNRKGDRWDYIISDPTQSSKYMLERYAYIWKNKNIKIKNRGRLINELKDKIEREPLLVDFHIYGKRFHVLNYHSIPNLKNPRDEIIALTDFIIKNAKAPVLLAGDFNLPEDDPVFKNFYSKGYQSSIINTKTTIKRECDHGSYLNYNIDNIYTSSSILKVTAGVIDFVIVCEEIENARKLSDHLPVYLTFKIQ